MRDRIVAKGIAPEKVVTLPPWSHDSDVRYDVEGRAAFRARHGLSEKFVVMYSGNHSPCHPLDTVLGAASALSVEREIVFCFVGGGSEYKKVVEFAAEHRLRNIVCLPYQPLKDLSASLSAADLHLVVMGSLMAGLVHPCKIYNVLALGIPLLYVGPASSHVGDIAASNPSLPIESTDHGDVAGIVTRIREAWTQSDARAGVPNAQMKKTATAFSMARLLPLYATALESSDASDATVAWSLPEMEPLVQTRAAGGNL
jgi:glycosyltransferase involved in cell wall biosynthesis